MALRDWCRLSGTGTIYIEPGSPWGRPLRRSSAGHETSYPCYHCSDDARLGTQTCPDCYDYTGRVLFNALAPELWRRFVIYLPRQLARLAGITQDQLGREVRVRFVKVAEYQHRGVNSETRAAQRRLHRVGGCLHTVL